MAIKNPKVKIHIILLISIIMYSETLLNTLFNTISKRKVEEFSELAKAEHTDKRRIHFSVKYSANGSKTKTEEILKKIKKEKIVLLHLARV